MKNTIIIEIVKTSTNETLKAKIIDIPETRTNDLVGAFGYILDTELCITGKKTAIYINEHVLQIIELENDLTKTYSVML